MLGGIKLCCNKAHSAKLIMVNVTPVMPMTSLSNNEDSGYDNDDSSDSCSSCNGIETSHKKCLFSTSRYHSKIGNHQCLIRNYDLSGHGLAILSHRTFQYLGNCVRKLILSNNKLHTLPDSISHLQNLEVLDISQNILTSLPMSLSTLHKLKELNLSNNNFQEIPTCLECGMESVTHIDISNNKIENSLKPPMCLPSLQCLNLSRNKFTSMPLWLFHDQCRSLVNINMSFNFCMDDNKFRSNLVYHTHFRVSALRTVQNLNLSNIGGKLDLIRALMFFQELKCVHLGNLPGNNDTLNNFSDVPVSVFYNPSSILELYLPNAGLTGIPDNFSRLKNLIKLDLSNNFLDWLPESFGELIYLEEILLSHCDLVYLPKNFHQLSNLIKLALNNNKLSTVHNELKGLSKLRCLDLYSNYLEELPLDKDDLRSITQLDLDYNYFDVQECLEERWHNLYKVQQASLRNGNSMYSLRASGPRIQSMPNSPDSCDSFHGKYEKYSDEETEEGSDGSYPEDRPCNSPATTVFEEEDWGSSATAVFEGKGQEGTLDQEDDWDGSGSDDSNIPDNNFDPNTIDRYYLPAGKYKFGWTPPLRPHKCVIPPSVIVHDFVFVPGQTHPKTTRRKRQNFALLKTVEGQFDDAAVGDTMATQDGEIFWEQIKVLKMFIRNSRGPKGYNCRICLPNEDCWHLGIWLPF